MSAEDGDSILMLHAPDGVEWARFLSHRLSTPSYNIASRLHDFTTTPSPKTSQPTQNQPICNGQSHGKDDDEEESIYLNETPENTDCDAIYTNEVFLPPDKRQSLDSDSKNSSSNSVSMCNTCSENNNSKNNTLKSSSQSKNDTSTCKHGTLTNKTCQKQHSTISGLIERCRVTVIFISPSVVEDEGQFAVDLASLDGRKTVFLLLGVELPEVMEYFGAAYQDVSRCHSSFIDGTEESICASVISIIDAYEDDEEEEEGEMEDVYKIPCMPVQLNKVDKVFPKVLTETEREVFILLSRIPEDNVTVVLEENSSSLPLVLVCERMYSFNLPADVFGEVNFQLECQGRRFGNESVHSYSKLDLVKKVLTEETNPHTLIASSLGLEKDDVGGVDTALAFKLQELAPVVTFKTLCPCEDALGESSIDDRSNKMWPTTLHFAAEMNLRLLTSELLRYPGMVAAACTMNRDGEFPSQIASRKGFHQLESDLIDFMKQVQREVDPDYVSSSQCSLSSHGGSITNLSDSVSIVSGVTDVSENTSSAYYDMSNVADYKRSKAPFLVVSQNSDAGDRRVNPPSRTHSDRSDASRGKSDNFRRPLPPRPESKAQQEEETYSSPDDSPRARADTEGSPASIKALKMLGATQEEVTSRYSIINPRMSMKSTASSMSPAIIRKTLFKDDDQISVHSNSDTHSRMLTSTTDKKNLVKVKVKGFFNRIKGAKRSPSVSNLFEKKTHGSNDRRESEPTTSKNHYKKVSNSQDEERDSGSFSDEEKRPKRNIFREKKQPMARRMSRRIEFAKTDRYSIDAPQLPCTEDRTSSFKSFIRS